MNAGLLVIGYGNELRRDDGVGPRLARIVASWGCPDLNALACHQLTPELAEVVASVDRVVFVDAGLLGDGEVSLRALEPAAVAGDWGHHGDPVELLLQARSLYGRCPRAWMLTVPALDLGFGEELSASAQRGLRAALEKIRMMADADGPMPDESELCTKSA